MISSDESSPQYRFAKAAGTRFRPHIMPTFVLAIALLLAPFLFPAAALDATSPIPTTLSAPTANISSSTEKSDQPQMLTPPEVWSSYDPDAGAMEEEVLKRWTTKNAAYKAIYFSAYINGETVRVYGIYAEPLKVQPGSQLPAIMHLHGGGQTVSEPWLDEWAARGYAGLSCNYHGEWENRKRFTIFPPALKQGNHKHSDALLMATRPNVRVSSWYIWSALARRSLSYLRTQPAVNPERIGAFGVSMGGTTMWSFAMDARLKAACAIYGCGWNRYYRYTPRFDPTTKTPAMTDDDRVWLAGMSPEGCAPFNKCPMLFLSGSNDTHGNMDRAYETLERLPQDIERRQSFTPRFCHHVGAESALDLFLWMDRWLKDGPAWPSSPTLKVSLGADGIPVATLHADKTDDVEKVAIYYAVKNPRPMSRNWRSAPAVPSAQGWQAALPALDTNDYLFAYANVLYKSGVQLSSNEEAIIPSSLGAARATDAASNVLYSGADGPGMWATNSPCVDPVPPSDVPVAVRPAVGPEGKAGFTVIPYLSPITYQPGDPKWRAPKDAGISFRIATSKPQTFKVVAYEDYAWPGERIYEAEVTLEGQPDWQTVRLFAKDFHQKKPDDSTGPSPANFTQCQALEFAATSWNDKNLVFTDVQWVTK